MGVRVARIAILLLLCLLVQVMLLPELRLFDAAPDLVLVAVIAVAYYSDPETGAVTGFAGGFLVDLFLRTPLGVSALTFALVGYAIALVRRGMMHHSRSTYALITGVATLVGGGAYLLLATLLGKEGLLSLHSLQVLVIASLLDALIAPLIFPLTRKVLAEDHPVGMR